MIEGPADPGRHRDIHLELGAVPEDLSELAAFTAGHSGGPWEEGILELPLSPEPHVPVWDEYARKVAAEGSFEILAPLLPQLRFPIGPGMSQAPDYLAATRRGEAGPGQHGLVLPLVQPGRVTVEVHSTPGGAIPVVTASLREDFETLVRAFVGRNEPIPVPLSQGACIVHGYNNWDRVRRHRGRWIAEGGREEDWPGEFRRMAGRKALYQDRFVLLCEGPYSGVAADAVGMDDGAWHKLSLGLRREHEFVHYLTRRIFPSAVEGIQDELVADFGGICAVAGRFLPEWFLLFQGLEAYPAYRPQGRLENYARAKGFSDGTLVALRALLHGAAMNIGRSEALGGLRLGEVRHRTMAVVALSRMSLTDLAHPQGAGWLDEMIGNTRDQLRWNAGDAPDPVPPQPFGAVGGRGGRAER